MWSQFGDATRLLEGQKTVMIFLWTLHRTDINDFNYFTSIFAYRQCSRLQGSISGLPNFKANDKINFFYSQSYNKTYITTSGMFLTTFSIASARGTNRSWTEKTAAARQTLLVVIEAYKLSIWQKASSACEQTINHTSGDKCENVFQIFEVKILLFWVL